MPGYENWIRLAVMIRPGILSEDEGAELPALAGGGHGEARPSGRVTAILPLNDGWSCGKVAAA